MNVTNVTGQAVHVGALFDGDQQALAAKVVMICTVVMWFVQNVSLIKGSDIKVHSKADKEAFGAEEDEDGDAPAFNIWGRIAANQLEQWPLSLAVYIGALLVGGNALVVMYGLILYIVLRLLFIGAYLKDVSPGRSVIFGLSMLTTLVVGIFGICGSIDQAVFVETDQKKAAKGLFVVTFLMFLLNMFALKNGIDPANHSAKDQEVFGLEVAEDPPFNYWAHIADNQLEQWPLSLAVYWGALFVGVHGFYVAWAAAVYLTLRMFYIPAYLQDITPGRSIVFLLSQIVTFAVATLGVIGACGGWPAVVLTPIFNDNQTNAAKTLMILTDAMWVLNFVSVLAGADPAKKSDADKKAFQLVVEENPPFNYWGRIAANQLEQFPLTLAVYWAALIFGGPSTFIMIAFIIYYLLRVAFIVAYLKDISPGRSVIFLLSNVVTLSVGIAGILGAFGVI